MRRGFPTKSTNPFDDDDDDDDEEGQGEIFHDAQEEAPKRRSAQLNFDNPFDDVEQPALRFDQVQKHSNEFVSPLESAMQQLASTGTGSPLLGSSSYPTITNHPILPSDNNINDNDDITESTPLLQPTPLSAKKLPFTGRSPRRHGIPTEISTSTGGPSPSRLKLSPITNSKRRLSQTKGGTKVVLTELASGDNEFTMDYKYILLEDLGTASSWLVLLLPYITFILALLLESSKSLKTTTLGPLTANMPCKPYMASNESSLLAPTMPCHASFRNDDWDPSRYPLSTGKYNTTMLPSSGVIFDSGDLSRIPVLSTELFGDAEFLGLTSPMVALVSQGLVESSVVVLQQPFEQNSDQWMLMFSSRPKTLAMACQRNGADDDLWDCKSPRIVNVVFSMPDAAVYAGGNLRVNVYFSLKDMPDATLTAKDDSPTTTVYTKSKQDSSNLQTTGIPDPNASLQKLVASSSYTFEHMSDLAMGLDTGVRLGTFAVSFWFVIYWCYCMGVHISCSICGSQKKKDSLWWESPWILFPERWYVVILLFSLLLMQEPVLAIMTFFPSLGSSTRLHVAADATIGIGVQGVLFVYLCLFRGLPFHTAAITKRRTEHQRQMLQLRRAAKYVAKSEHPLSPTEATISDYVTDYFDRFGDVDGSASPAFLRLANDPCGDGWADFLFFKLLLLFLGIASVIGTAYCRFPPDDHDDAVGLSDSMIRRYKWAYIACIFVQFATVVIWMLSIIVAAIVAGRKLRKEPFLGTRPAQLVYRILLAHVSLGFLVLSLGFGTNFSQALRKWSPNSNANNHDQMDSLGDDERSKLELIIRVLSGVAQQFPYNGTAASVGSGKVLFATVSILITAFIFLPAHVLDEDDDEPYVETWGTTWTTNLNDKLHEKRRLRRDKRLVINLARDSRTWRVFPLPIKQTAVSTTILQDNVFQLYQDLHTDGNTKGRGVVSVGPYTPVFCLEIACWLNEASWQAYYSPAGIKPLDPDIPAMHLEGIGLRLEGAVYDESTDTQAYVATNLAAQVDGDEDTIIVVAFRGSTSPTNLQTDLKSRQVPLLDQLTGIGLSPFSVFIDRVEVNDDDGWIWETPEPEITESLQCVVSWVNPKPAWVPGMCSRKEEDSKLSAVSKGARKILQATPVARDSFPLVHDGFQEVYSHIRRKLLDILLPVLQRQLGRVVSEGQSRGEREPLALPKIYCTGHSLGGSLAQLLALDLANNCGIMLPTQLSSNLEHFYDAEMGGKSSKNSRTSETGLRLQPPIAVYTFGQPRIGNKAFSRLYKQRVPHTFRVVNEGDAITSMPNRLFCGGVYKHSGLEVLLDEGQTGNILVGPTVVETLFRFHQMRTSVLAHTMQRYRDCLECAFAQDELLEYYRGHNLVAGNVMHHSHETALVVPTEIPEWMTNLSRTRK